MYTHRYKTGWIHGHCDGSRYVVQFSDYSTKVVKSYRAAQLAITRRAT